MMRVVLLLALAAVSAGAQTRPQRLTDSQRDLYARLIAMADTRTLDTSAVDLALASTSQPLAAFAALSVGQLSRVQGARRIPRLRGLLVDPRSRVAGNAAYALGLLRDTVSIGALTAALSASDVRALEAAWALGQIGEPARSVIVTALGNDRHQPAVRVQLLLAATKLRPVPVEAILPHLSSSDRYVVWAASYAIARPRAPAGVRELLALAASSAVRSPDTDARPADGYYGRTRVSPDRIRAEIARGIALPAAGDSLGDSAFTVLRRLARDPHPHVRINAVRSLATFGERATALLDSATLDRDANARIAALQSIATARGVQLDWNALWERDTSFTWRRYVAETAFTHDARLGQLDRWLTHADWRRRAAAAGALASSRDAAVRQGAAPLVTDEDPRVRAAALGALGADTTALSDTARAIVIRALTDADETTRSIAISALGRRPSARDIPLVVAALENAWRDNESDARVSAIGYLNAAWRRDSSAFTADLRDRLAAIQTSPDPVTRNAAASFPLLRHWVATPLQPRSAQWYSEAVAAYVIPALTGHPPTAVIHTARGAITLELFSGDAPITVRNFAELARRGFYDDAQFHRVVPNFVAQDGDPRGDGTGGPGYSIRDELNPRRYERGVLGMALSGPDTGGSQWFITHSPQPHLDGGYTVFGRVADGYPALDALVQGDRIVRIEIR